MPLFDFINLFASGPDTSQKKSCRMLQLDKRYHNVGLSEITTRLTTSMRNESALFSQQRGTKRYRFEASHASSLDLHKSRSGRKTSAAWVVSLFVASPRCFFPRFGTFHGTWIIFEGLARMLATLCLMFVRATFVLSFSFCIVFVSVGFSSCDRLRLPGVATVFSFLRHRARLFWNHT